MNLPLNLRQLLKHAEACNDAKAWEAFARNLMAEKNLVPAAGGRRRKPAPARAPKLRGTDERYLTLTERRALGLPPAKDGKIGGGPYVFVLVEFADGVKMLTGQYPRAKDPADMTQAVISARARYLRTNSGGVRISPKARIPAVVKVTAIAHDQVEAWRDRCHQICEALDAFTFAPHWQDGMPRSIAWVARQAFAWREQNGPDAPLSPWDRILSDHGHLPAWWRLEYRGEERGW